MMKSHIVVPPRYDAFSRLLHWVVAVVIIYAMCMGYVLHALEGTEYFQFFSVLNMSLGTVATPIMLIRFVWRFFRPSVPYPRGIEGVKKSVVVLAHEVFYLAIFVTLISGFLMLKQGYNLFGLYPIPQPFTNPEINRFFFQVHRYACISVGVLLALHVLAICKHQLIEKRNILSRML
ncbi:cytochrome b [Serratia ficaria]|uniref:cytochrome b n=1 Tax=Serratia ficaria TaxID=61651 RepID=UPI0021BD6BAC|nr:cytochrome b/b6 domain-containing protein [Serratia ficaria]